MANEPQELPPEPHPSQPWIISAKQVYKITNFPSQLHGNEESDLSVLHEFLENKSPFSHLGHWRNQIDPLLTSIEAFVDSDADVGSAITTVKQIGKDGSMSSSCAHTILFEAVSQQHGL